MECPSISDVSLGKTTSGSKDSSDASSSEESSESDSDEEQMQVSAEGSSPPSWIIISG